MMAKLTEWSFLVFEEWRMENEIRAQEFIWDLGRVILALRACVNE